MWPEQTEAFAYDNESPRHRALVGAFALASRPVTCGEFGEFIRDNGYANPMLWLSDGWDTAQAVGWRRPLYWIDEDREYTLGGVRVIDWQAPVCHLSYYEADAFARWAGSRLPTEFEWETAAATLSTTEGNFAESGRLHPAATAGSNLRQMFGDVWEWTSSAYLPYPGFRPMPGTLGEYNGKFMVIALPTEAEQVVLLIKGQAWVVRKIDEIPPAEMGADEKAFFADMREVHVVNIDKCKKLVS